MRRLLRISVLIGLANSGSTPISFGQTAGALPNNLTQDEKLAGWELLFDGQTTKGWRSPSSDRFPTEHWGVEGGFLRTLVRRDRTSDLMTAGVYRNFELSFEWKIAPGGNSGVKYLVGGSQKLVFQDGKPPSVEGMVNPGPGAVFMEVTSGFEYQVIDDERHPDKDQPNTRSGALYQFAGPGQNGTKPAGHINLSRIVWKGPHLEHWLNGVRVVAIDVASAEFQATAAKAPARSRRALNYLNQDCPIALQSHTGEVWFRNIKLRRLADH